MSNNQESPLNYMTEDEAKEVHKLFIVSMGFFTTIAIIAHILVWAWRPWLAAGEPQSASLLESGAQFAQAIASTLLA
jgi:light-harvesting complex 1 beta chain